MTYDFVPMPKRKPLRWPNGARLAIIMTANLEYWDKSKETDAPAYPGGPGIVTNMMTGRYYDNPNWTWREYGQRVGIWRIYEAFEQADLPLTCTINAKMALHRREVVDHAVSRGWEIVAHNYVQTDALANYEFDIEGERKVIRDTLKVYEDVVGKPARGWLSSSLRSTPNTVDLLAEEGLLYFCDLLNDDQPYLLRPKNGRPMVSVSYSGELNDFQTFMHQGKGVDDSRDVFIEQFNELYREGATSGRMMNVGLHPHVIGQPFRIRALREFLGHAKQFPDVWWTTREEVAEWYLKNHAEHIA